MIASEEKPVVCVPNDESLQTTANISASANGVPGGKRELWAFGIVGACAGSNNQAPFDLIGPPPFRVIASNVGVASNQPSIPAQKDGDLEKIFAEHVTTWKKETRGSSLTARRYAHPSYQAILVLGGRQPRTVTGLILQEMQRTPDMWFEALRRLNDTDAAKSANATGFEEATKAWLAWGRREKLIS